MYGSETVVSGEKEISRIGAVEMDKLRGSVGIRRMPNSRVIVLCDIMKKLN